MRKPLPFRLSVLVVAGLSLLPAAPSHATIPELDYGTLIQELLGNMSSLMDHMDRIGLMQSRNRALGMMGSENSEAWTNGFTNAIARGNQQPTDVQNLEQLQNNQPLKDACAQFSRSMDLGNAYCGEEIVQEKARSGRSRAAIDPTVLKTLTARLEAATTPPAAGATAGNTGKPAATPLTVFDFGSTLPGSGKSVLTPDDEQLAMDMALLVAPGALAKANQPSPDSTVPATLHRMAREIKLAMAHESLVQVMAHKATDDKGRSPAMTVEQVSELDFQAPPGGKSILEIVATANDLGPANLVAMQTERRAWRLHLALLQYQSRLRQEALQAAGLLDTVNASAR